jgi:superfamily II DNA helicase RecQ
VVHIEDPYGLIDFAQESGRGGRDGEAAGSTVFMKRDPRLALPPIPLDRADPTDQEAINEYLRGLRCRRMCLAQELDEAKYRQTCGELDMECDICEARREQGIALTDPPETNLRQGTILECSDDNVAEEAEDESENGGAIRYRRR